MRNSSSCLNTYPIARNNFTMLRKKPGTTLSLDFIGPLTQEYSTAPATEL